MSLIQLLEGCKDVAMAAREQAAAASAADVADFEEYGEDLAAAFDEQEIAETEEALRLADELDEREEELVSEREREDLELAKQMLEAEQDTDAACEKDEAIAREMEAMLKKEAVRVAKLERRERQLANKKLCKGDLAMAEQLAADIEREEEELLATEAKDRRLARSLVKDENRALAALPQTEEKLRHLSRSINGDGPVSMRTRMRAKLVGLRTRMTDITNRADATAAVTAA